MKLSRLTREHLGFYVYGLVDPDGREIFYIGKASSNNRAFDHLNAAPSETQKSTRIAEIRARGEEPLVEILRYGLSNEKEAFEVEAALIDAFGLEKLTNLVRGHGIDRGRLTIAEVERLYGSKNVTVTEVPEPVMLFFINKTYYPTIPPHELYDCVRQFWYGVSQKTRQGEKYKIALGVVDGVVISAYTIAGWYPAGTTLSTRDFSGAPNKWEFVGQEIAGHALVGKRLVEEGGDPILATQNGYRYLE